MLRMTEGQFRERKPAKYRNVKKEPSESQHQAAVIAWWDVYAKTKQLDPSLLFAVPNGSVLAGDARRRAMQMHRLKCTGLRVGCPDLILALPSGAFHGMFIEMKSKEGKVNEDQREYHTLLRRHDYNVVTAFGSDEAITAIKAYVERSNWRESAWRETVAGNDRMRASI
jgi:VRR-NUC domain-containing protein